MEQNFNDLMKEAQKMQEKMQQIQEQLKNSTVYGEAGGGMVKITMSGTHDVLKVEFADSVMDKPKDIIEGIVQAACNDAVQKVEKKSKEEIGNLAKGFNLPLGEK